MLLLLADGRTWGLAAIGARRRLTMALLPIMYKMGVGTTLLGVLVFLALKTMFMVSILFVLAVTSFAKHKLSALHQPYVHYAPPQHHKEVHVHVHSDPHKQVSMASRRQMPICAAIAAQVQDFAALEPARRSAWGIGKPSAPLRCGSAYPAFVRRSVTQRQRFPTPADR